MMQIYVFILYQTKADISFPEFKKLMDYSKYLVLDIRPPFCRLNPGKGKLGSKRCREGIQVGVLSLF